MEVVSTKITGREKAQLRALAAGRRYTLSHLVRITLLREIQLTAGLPVPSASSEPAVGLPQTEVE